MIEPIRIEFDVEAPPAHAFEVWTGRIDLWWPLDHTVTGADDLRVVLEGRQGGRIYERTRGTEHDWGEVLAWEPPHRIVYLWHLKRNRADATEVEIQFHGTANGTRVEIEHRGWERLGSDGASARDGNMGGWQTLLPHYVTVVKERGMTEGNGTKESPWRLKTAPGTSEYAMWRDEAADPPVLVCQVGSTQLTYALRAIEDLQAWLKAQGDWVPLGAADEQKDAAPGTVEAFGRATDNPVGGWYGLRKGYRGRFGMYLPPLLEALGMVELEHNPRNNRVRAI